MAGAAAPGLVGPGAASANRGRGGGLAAQRPARPTVRLGRLGAEDGSSIRAGSDLATAWPAAETGRKRFLTPFHSHLPSAPRQAKFQQIFFPQRRVDLWQPALRRTPNLFPAIV